ncbi:type I restriction enzyme S subunit [Limnobacter thiooxidans]|uniref:Type I restriction enzyme, S subunit n=1 Tax=Limnobacter thiooxidans TaxID=131080 RepID=A0AA86M956_9BURK|nr:type I restriction enzyme S subunit [Limnobacter thiooxidans]BET27269.1 hypothetical protein RGQ30_27700 [Limnobacter thiooxidans]
MNNAPLFSYKRVGSLVRLLNGHPFDSTNFHHEGMPLVRIRDIGKTKTELSYRGDFPSTALITTKDVLVGMDGDFNIGRWKGNTAALLNQRCLALRHSDTIILNYLEYLLPKHLQEINDLTYATTVKHLSSSQVAKLRVFVPEERNLLLKVVAFLNRETAKIDSLIAKQERLIELIQENQQAVISRAITKGLDSNVKMKVSGIGWLGDVPEHWVITKIKYIKSPSANSFVDGPFGSNLKSEHFVEDGEVLVIESNFATTGNLFEQELKKISQQHFETIKRSEVSAGDIVIAKIGARFGSAAILPPLSKQAVVSGNSLKLNSCDRLTSNRWIVRQLNWLKWVGQIDLLVNGSAQPALSLGGMNTLVTLLPPIKEQSTILDYIEEKENQFRLLMDKAITSIKLLKEHRQALISAAVTGEIDVGNLVTDEEVAMLERASESELNIGEATGDEE